jgi:hypothetical protein
MSPLSRFGLVLLCWLALAAPVTGSPPAQHTTRRAEVTLSVADAQRTVAGLEELARAVRGRFVDGGVRALTGGRPGVEATLELPPEMLETALARLRGMALSVLSEEVQSRDLSRQVEALNQRLQGLRARRRQLRELAAQATTRSERDQVETSLAAVNAEIDEVEAALSALRHETDWAVLHVLAYQAPPTATPVPTPRPSSTPTATVVPVTPSPTPWRPGETVEQATDVLVFIVQGLVDVLIVFTVVAGPFLALALVLGLVGRWLSGRARG